MFGTIVEFAIVLVIRQKSDWSQKEEPRYKELNKFQIIDVMRAAKCQRNLERVVQDDNSSGSIPAEDKIIEDEKSTKSMFHKNMPFTAKIDFVAFIVLTSSYLAFNITYFGFYLN